MIHDDQGSVVLPPGVTIEPKPKLIAPDKVFFGWLDHVGDENTFRFEDIIGAQRAKQDGRYYLYVRQIANPIAIPEKDYIRLLRKMGWTESSRIARSMM